MSWNWSLKGVLFAIFGIIIGSLGTLIYLEVDISKLPELPDGLLIATVVLAGATIQLVITTQKYAKSTEGMLEANIKHTEIANDMLNEQRKIMKTDRLLKEMDLLVAPLFSEKNNVDFFEKKYSPTNIPDSLIQKQYDLWDGIKQNAYLGSSDLREKLDNYFSNKSVIKKSSDFAFFDARKELWVAIQKRYDELNDELSKL